MSNSRHFCSATLPHDDPRYIKWRESLKGRDTAWNRGLTKETDKRVMQISVTMKRKRVDNFYNWRESARNEGLIPDSKRQLHRDEILAFLIGITLGDGHIDHFPRTERLVITLGIDKPLLISFTNSVIEKVFHRQATIYYPKGENAIRLVMYERNISQRLRIPYGDRAKLTLSTPVWIKRKKAFLLSYLRGLYEAEASLNVHLPTCTYNFAFSNTNSSLLQNVEQSLISLGLNPEIRSNAIRLRRKNEVKYFAELIKFRQYPQLDAGWSNGSLVAL